MKSFAPIEATMLTGRKAYLFLHLESCGRYDIEELKEIAPRPALLVAGGSVVARKADFWQNRTWTIEEEYKNFVVDPGLCIMSYSLIMASLN